MSQVRSNSITNAAGTGAPDLPNGLTVADGTAAAPSITNTDDTNTGVFFPAADTVSIATGGVERMRVNSSGNVGVGTTSPSAPINVALYGTSTTPTLSGAALRVETGPFGISETLIQIVGRDSSAGAGIHFGLGSNPSSTRIVSFGSSSGLFFQERSGGYISFWTDAGSGVDERFRIDAAGNAIFYRGIIEKVFALSGTTPALDPTNGTIQTWTLSGNSSPTDSLVAGESMTLMIDDGSAFTITWPSVTWVNNAGAAPTLRTTGYTVVALWKVSTTLYGALVGNGS
jgi:hypothetical protein